MKKNVLLFLMLALLAVVNAQPSISKLSYPDTTPVFSLFEISFKMKDYANPYDPDVIRVYADFSGPDRQTFRVEAFYYEGYGFQKEHNTEKATPKRDADGWRIRFTPNTVGEWRFTLHAIDKKGHVDITMNGKKELAFHCQSVDAAEGFIAKANSRYLKREAFVKGKRQEHSFFPIGPNVAWYSAADYGKYRKPYGIYEYEQYMQNLSGCANYLRIWINRYQFLSLYGPEHAATSDGKPHMYFDKSLNQKDSAELDYIIAYAAEHGFVVMPCIFNFRDFIHKENTPTGTPDNPAMPSDWLNNPFHTILGLDSPYQFFTDKEAKQFTRNLLRYIVSRWGYATNILCWELWNEVANMEQGKVMDQQVQQDILDWHREMADYIRLIDPSHHLVSTSIGSVKKAEWLYSSVFETLDIVQDHNYQNIQKAASKEQLSFVLYREAEKARLHYGFKPFFMGEFGFGQNSDAEKYAVKDPYGIDLHNSLWSSAFSGSMGPASFWYWQVLRENKWFERYQPLLTFFNEMPLLSESFKPQITGWVDGRVLVFPNNLETYYLVNASEDTLMGWSQDTAFCYQSLRHLTDEVGKNNHFDPGKVKDADGYVYTLRADKRPNPSSNSNTIVLPIRNQERGTLYQVRWYDAETGRELSSEATTVAVRRFWFRKYLAIEFPSSIRDLSNGTVNNTFGDAVFVISKIQ